MLASALFQHQFKVAGRFVFVNASTGCCLKMFLCGLWNAIHQHSLLTLLFLLLCSSAMLCLLTLFDLSNSLHQIKFGICVRPSSFGCDNHTLNLVKMWDRLQLEFLSVLSVELSPLSLIPTLTFFTPFVMTGLMSG